jgi:hypothetical protein
MLYYNNIPTHRRLHLDLHYFELHHGFLEQSKPYDFFMSSSISIPIGFIKGKEKAQKRHVASKNTPNVVYQYRL